MFEGTILQAYSLLEKTDELMRKNDEQSPSYNVLEHADELLQKNGEKLSPYGVLGKDDELIRKNNEQSPPYSLLEHTDEFPQKNGKKTSSYGVLEKSDELMGTSDRLSPHSSTSTYVYNNEIAKWQNNGEKPSLYGGLEKNDNLTGASDRLSPPSTTPSYGHSKHVKQESYLEIKVDDAIEECSPTPAKKGRGRPKKHVESIEWSDAATEALIELWQTKEELFCRNHPYFYAKDYKDKAIEEIRVGMESRGFHSTTNQILGKIQSLRTYFCSQRAKFQQMKKAGQITEDENECRWRFYKSLQFLDENMKPRENVKRNERMNGMDSYMNNSLLPPSMNYPSSFAYDIYRYDGGHQNNIHPSHTTSPVSSTQNSHEDMHKQPCNGVNYQNNNKLYEDKLFGELVGNMMTQLPPGQHKDLLKLEIQQLIIKAKYEVHSNGDL